MCTLIINLSQQPVIVRITWEKDRVGLVSCALLELDCNGHQLLAGVDIEKAKRSSSEVAVLSWQPIHDFHVTDIDVTSLG